MKNKEVVEKLTLLYFLISLTRLLKDSSTFNLCFAEVSMNRHPKCFANSLPSAHTQERGQKDIRSASKFLDEWRRELRGRPKMTDHDLLLVFRTPNHTCWLPERPGRNPYPSRLQNYRINISVVALCGKGPRKRIERNSRRIC